jgi:hypothetical protein
MRRPPLSPGIRPSGSSWRACGPAGAPAVRRTGFGDGQEDTSTDQQHSGIFLLTGRFPWITLAPQESRNNGNRPGPTGSMGSQSSGPSIHSGYLLGCSPSIRAHRHGGATCLPALLAMEVQEKLGRLPRLDVHLAGPLDSGGRRCGMTSVCSQVTSGLRQGPGNELCSVWAVREPSIVTRDVGITCLIGVPTANRPGPGRPGGRSASDHRDRTRAPRCRCGRG